MPSLRTVLIGCGKVGQIHGEALSRLPESELVGVCDQNLDRARAFANQYGGTAYDNIDTLFKDSGAQVALICTPHPLHAEPVLAAAEHGIHALVEKPLAANLADCDAMIAASQRAGTHLGVISQRRTLECVQRMRSAIDAGKIGRPVLGTFTMLSWRDEAYYRSDPWRGKWSTEGGGVLINQSPHGLDLLQWFMGEIEEISGYWANLNHPTIEVEDTAIATVRFKNNALGSIVASLSQKPGIYSKIHIHGSNGASVGAETDRGATFVAGMTPVAEPAINDLWTIPGEESLLEGFQNRDRTHFSTIHPINHYHAVQIQQFLHAVLEGRDPPVSAEEGRTVVAMITAIYRSNQLRQPIRFPVFSDL